MLKNLQSTSYTPIFPPPLPVSDSQSLASVSCDSALTSNNNDPIQTTQKSYVDRLKERHLLLSGLPEELCPPSREASPGVETRIEALALRMRKAHELRLPLELTLTCVGVKGGDWIGVSLSDEIQGGRQYCLPATEEEWFDWEKKQIEVRDRWIAEKTAAEYRDKIEKWSEEVKEDPFLDAQEFSHLAQEQRRLTTDTRGYSVMSGNQREGQCVTSRYFPHAESPDERLREHSEPVERTSSPLPPAPAPALDPLPEFCDSFSLPDSPPLLPRDASQNPPIPDEIQFSPSFVVKDIDTSTPPKQKHVCEPVLQLSSPISPPRCLRALTASQTSISMSVKRPHESGQPLAVSPYVDGMSQPPSTPRGVKRARTEVEPITPKSVRRPRDSQECNFSQDPKRLPTLDALLAASARKAPLRKGTPSIKAQPTTTCAPCRSPSPRRTSSSPVLDFSVSQPTYSMFRPQLQSTQHRVMSLPPSPNQPKTSIQPVSPEKMLSGTASSGIGFYQSQFNVESRVDQVTAFLNADVWNVEA